MQRKWLVGVVAGVLALAAVLALIVGGVVGRSIVPSPTTPTTTPQTASPPAAVPDTVRFTDTLTDVSIAYPRAWVRRMPNDQAVRILAASSDAADSVSVSVRDSGLEEKVTLQTLPVVRSLTDDLLRADTRITAIAEPLPVTIGGVPGYRYRYTYTTADKTEGAHDHYFLFNKDKLIQVVLQAVPSTGLKAVQPTFDRIAQSFLARKP